MEMLIIKQLSFNNFIKPILNHTFTIRKDIKQFSALKTLIENPNSEVSFNI